jgi:prepilin-type N-terminal cleavage/methylation domain-containing protein
VAEAVHIQKARKRRQAPLAQDNQMKRKTKTGKRKHSQLGVSMIEVLVVVAILAVVAAMTIPNLVRLQKNARLNGDAHSLAESLSVAKMRAAADYTESRVFFFTGSDKTQYFRIDVWNKAANGGAGCWVPDDVNNPGTGTTYCITNSSFKGSETYLSTGVSAGLASLTTAQDGTSASQAAACKQGGSSPTTGSTISNTSCIQFNSRGFPTAAGTFYITDSARVYEVATNSMGLIKSYLSSASTASWIAY